MSEDPIGFDGGINFYAYVNNNPINFNDPSGKVVESPWDILNVGLGVYSLQENIRSGSYGWAALDAAGLVYDGLATAIPFLPAGAAAGLQAWRAGNGVVDAANIGLDIARTADVANDAARLADISGNAAIVGSQIHRQVGSTLNSENLLSGSANNFFWGSNRAYGPQPDLSWPGSGMWADLTTSGQWGRHVNTYGDSFGTGIPLLYERGVGLVGTSRLSTGAGVGTFGLESVTNFYSGSDNTNGGFVLYPNKINTNITNAVYSK